MRTGNDATSSPYPSDLYDCRSEQFDPANPLTALQEALLLSVCPAGGRIVEARPVRKKWLPCPSRAWVALPSGETLPLILRLDCHRGGVEREAAVLPTLARLGLPVPALLAGPVFDPDRPTIGAMSVLSVLPGENLGNLTWSDAMPVERSNALIHEAIARLHAMTGPLANGGIAGFLPRQTLADELQVLAAKAGPWRDQPRFAEAVQCLRPVVASIATPLAFTNGDYNPGNFLSDGQALTGFVDFAGACFEDPHAGFAQYAIYDWSPFNHAGVVERYQEMRALSQRAFAPRMAVRCLRPLRREVPVAGGNGRYREHVLGLLDQALAAL